jgi:hypothetical protein
MKELAPGLGTFHPSNRNSMHIVITAFLPVFVAQVAENKSLGPSILDLQETACYLLLA